MNPHGKKVLQVFAWGLILIVIPLLLALWVVSAGISILLLHLIVKMHPNLRSKVDRIVNELFLDVSVLRPPQDNNSP